MYDNKVVVITGGTSGIGEATALAFANLGANVIITGRNVEKGKQIAAKSEELIGDISFIECDLRNENDIQLLKDYVQKKFNRVDVLFNNAGMMPESKEIERLSLDEWKETMDVNFNGLFLVTRTLKAMIISCKGCIINNASIAGLHSYVAGRSYAYSASKSAVIQFTRQMALNYAEEGVRVNAIAPGIIETKILGSRDRNEYAKRIPMGYIGDPDIVADVVVFLASQKARYITGAIIPVDGGVSLC